MSRKSPAWAALVKAGLKAKKRSAKGLSLELGMSHSYVGQMAISGWIPNKNLVEAIAQRLELPVEECLLHCGYSNDEIKDGFGRFRRAIKDETPIVARRGVVVAAPLPKASFKDIVEALTSASTEYDRISAEKDSLEKVVDGLHDANRRINASNAELAAKLEKVKSLLGV